MEGGKGEGCVAKTLEGTQRAVKPLHHDKLRGPVELGVQIAFSHSGCGSLSPC